MDKELKENAEILLYSIDDSNIYVDVYFEDENFWLTQKSMAELFDVEVNTINYHLKEIFVDEELDEDSTIRNFRIVKKEGTRNVSREVKFYNLDAIIAVGYRVNSKKATKFRQWSTKTLKEYITKGFVLNDEMLKNGKPFDKDYFDELLEKIREIRASERRAYQKITDIFEQCSYDYDKTSAETKDFYSFVQNKLHYAVTGYTAAEIIMDRSDSSKPTMGLTTWKDAPNGKILQRDVVVAKNYLNKKEISRLNRLVTMFIDYAELMAEDEILMSMSDWIEQTNVFLKNNRRNVLEGKGHVSHKDATDKAINEYKVFRKRQDEEYVSEFDRQVQKYLKGE